MMIRTIGLATALVAIIVLIVCCCHDELVDCQTYMIDTVAGFRYYAPNGGLAKLASLYHPVKVAIHHRTEDIYIADAQHSMIRKFNETSGIIMTVAGTGEHGYSGDGGLAINAKLNRPEGLVVSDSGEVYIADRGNHCIRKVDVNGIITTVAGTGFQGYDGEDGNATATRLSNPHGVAVLQNGDVLFSDTNNHRIRKVSLDGQISTIAGNGTGHTMETIFLQQVPLFALPRTFMLSQMVTSLFLTETIIELGR